MSNFLASHMSLAGRRALITGGAGHLGRVIALTLRELGADLILVDRAGDALERVRAELLSTGTGAVDIAECDLESERARDAFLSSPLVQEQPLSVLVNNAAFVGTSALSGWSAPFAEQTVSAWRRALEVNVTAAFALSQGLLPLLRASRGASIVNIGSIYGVVGPDWSLYDGTAMANPAAYAVSKAGLLQLTRWMATTLAPTVRVNAITPGGIARGQPDAFVEKYIARTPLQRMATEDDFRGAIAFLASDLSAYVTGQNLIVDGGWTSW
jgi:NAD(P)-dependent dehydrogenase (short-subunit alcohol dehydrogenase family)